MIITEVQRNLSPSNTASNVFGDDDDNHNDYDGDGDNVDVVMRLTMMTMMKIIC